MQFLKFINPKLEENTLRRVGWDVLGTMVTIPTRKTAVVAYASFLQGVTAEALPEVIPRLSEIGRQIRDPQGMLLTPKQRTERAGRLLASALALTLLEKKVGQLETQPGQFYFHRGNEKINVFALMDELIAGKLSGDAWVWRCNELGINGAPPQTTYRVIELRCLPIWEKIQKQNGRPRFEAGRPFCILVKCG
ncbi:MAG: hypothetical protein DMG50_20525 [Acidobacteria bacterium]|nr:MAG: hypothetical protein DMG50_20525 [Acidobacteriota bacterium]